jgi:hypothetical protein
MDESLLTEINRLTKLLEEEPLLLTEENIAFLKARSYYISKSQLKKLNELLLIN